MFVNKTASLFDKIGCSDFNTAIRCLRDAEISNNPEREFVSALTLLKSSIEKIKSNNKYKFQGALIIGVCYKLLQEDVLSEKYLKMSIELFKEWIYSNRPVGLVSCGIIRTGAYNRTSYSDFKKEIISFGLKWRGESAIHSFMSWNPILMNEDVSTAIVNAIEDYSIKVNHIFDSQPEYKCVCKKCNREVRLIEPDGFSSNETASTILLIAKMFDYKVLACEYCGNMFHVNSEGEIVCLDKSGKDLVE